MHAISQESDIFAVTIILPSGRESAFIVVADIYYVCNHHGYAVPYPRGEHVMCLQLLGVIVNGKGGTVFSSLYF